MSGNQIKTSREAGRERMDARLALIDAQLDRAIAALAEMDCDGKDAGGFMRFTRGIRIVVGTMRGIQSLRAADDAPTSGTEQDEGKQDRDERPETLDRMRDALNRSFDRLHGELVTKGLSPDAGRGLPIPDDAQAAWPI